MSAPATPDRRLYVVATSHLDTQWRWTFRDTIQRYLPSTLRENFDLFRRYPLYEFNFEGAFRYMLAKEYWPELYEELKAWIAAGRWHVCGASVDAGDVNTVSPESLIRHALYGNGFFRAEFGKVSRDIFLPDCFGFGWALPSVAAHCGLKSFSTSKLEWGSSCGIPFNVGFWEGVNGDGVVACINPGQYANGLQDDWLSKEKWIDRIDATGAATGAYVDFKYFGLGDVGGSPDAQSVMRLDWAIVGSTDIAVKSAAADALALSLTDEQIARLPRHRGEFLLIEHGTGTYTSHGEMKRWNRANETLADAAEKASVAAEWLGAVAYPQEKLTQAWVRFLANQMHDILPGTSIPEAYQLSWNDEVLSLNQFAAALKDAVGGIARLMDTRGEGTPIVVFNPLGVERIETLILPWSEKLDGDRIVVDAATGKVAGRLGPIPGGQTALMLAATVPALGLNVFRVLPGAEDPASGAPIVRVGYPTTSFATAHKKSFSDATSIMPRGEADEYPGQQHMVGFDTRGRVRSIVNQATGRELLGGPIDLQLLDHAPKEWPAWTIVHDDVSRAPRSVADGPVDGNGARAVEGSSTKQRVRFVQTAYGEAVEIEWEIDWQTPGTILKAVFPLAASNPTAVYDLGLGVVERGNNREKLHEVPALQWAHVTDKSGEFGVSIMADCKFGWDKPDDSTLRLTLVHSPRMAGFKCYLGGANYTDHFLEQEQLDFGPHKVRVRIMATPGDWRAGKTPQAAAAFNQPLLAFIADKHEGPLGRSFSFAKTGSDAVAIKALKKAEDGAGEYVVRLQELEGRAQKDVRVHVGAGIVAARELNGMEEHIADLVVERDGALALDFKPFGLRTIAVKLATAPHRAEPPTCAFVDIPFNCRAISTNANRQDGDIDGEGNSLPSEQLPEIVRSEGIAFRTGPRRYKQPNAVACRGQRIDLPAGEWTHVYVLAAGIGPEADGSRGNFVESRIRIGDREERFRSPGYTGFVGQWHDRVVDGVYENDPAKFRPAFARHAEVAWCCSHRHSGKSNADEAYQYTYLFKFGWKLGVGDRSIEMPDDARMRVLAVTVARNGNEGVKPAVRLFE